MRPHSLVLAGVIAIKLIPGLVGVKETALQVGHSDCVCGIFGKGLKDTDFACLFCYLVLDLATSTTPETWIVYGQEKYHFPLAAGCTAVVAPGMYPFLHTQQLLGLIAGMKGAAEYEGLVGRPAEATEGMLPQSVVHLLVIALVLAGNATYVWGRRRARGRG